MKTLNYYRESFVVSLMEIAYVIEILVLKKSDTVSFFFCVKQENVK